MPDASGFYGFQPSSSAGSQFNALAFLIQTMMRRISVATMVEIKGVTNTGGVSPVGYVDILPLVNQIDGDGNATPHATIYHCPYMRIQGGASAIILDPKVGDLGMAVFADHDISSVLTNQGQANPGSFRRFDMADAMVVAFWSPNVPVTQYVQLNDSGITINSPNGITINSGGAVAITSSSLTHNGVNIGATHVHGGVATGGANTAVPH